jgi:small-conductance mechanosensitive channel
LTVNKLPHNYLVYKKIDDLNSKIGYFDKLLEEINIKIINFESMPIMNNQDDDKKYTNDELSAMLQSLEKKLSQKIIFIDSKFNKIDEDILKLKQLEKGLEQTNRNAEVTNKNVEFNKEQIAILFAKIEDLKSNCKNNHETTMITVKQQLENFKKYFDDSISE